MILFHSAVSVRTLHAAGDRATRTLPVTVPSQVLRAWGEAALGTVALKVAKLEDEGLKRLSQAMSVGRMWPKDCFKLWLETRPLHLMELFPISQP